MTRELLPNFFWGGGRKVVNSVEEKKAKKAPAQKDIKRLKTLIAVSKDRNIDVSSIGEYQIGDDSALTVNQGQSPYLDPPKSTLVNNYLKPQFNDAFSKDRSFDPNITVIDAESKLFVQPKNKESTSQDTVVDVFKSQFLDDFQYCDRVALIFDQREFNSDASEILELVK